MGFALTHAEKHPQASKSDRLTGFVAILSLLSHESQIPADDLCPTEGIDGGSASEKGAIGNGEFHIPFLNQHDGKADDTADKGREEDGKKNALPADKGPYHGQELDVSSAHSSLPGESPIHPGYQPQASPADDNAQGVLLPGEVGDKEGEKEEDENARQGDHIGDDAVVDIDKGDGDENTEEDEVGQGVCRRAEGVEGNKCKPTGEGFDGRVSIRDPALAAATSSSYYKVA